MFSVAGRFGLSDRAELTDEVQHSRRVFPFLHCGGAVVEVEVPRRQLHGLVDEDLDVHGHKVCGRSRREGFEEEKKILCNMFNVSSSPQFIPEPSAFEEEMQHVALALNNRGQSSPEMLIMKRVDGTFKLNLRLAL